LSIPSNIAEWADRWSQKEFVRFLFIARWSCSELKTQFHILKELEYITIKDFENIMKELIEIHKMINAFIKKINSHL
jgi:four helix bundle protein